MSVVEYLAAAALTWAVGFIPLFEIYVAIPVGLAAGLDPLSTTFLAALGNILPLYVVNVGYEWLRQHQHVDRWLAVLRRERVERVAAPMRQTSTAPPSQFPSR